MKQKIYLVLIISIISSICFGNNYFEIKKNVLDFLIKYEDYTEGELSNDLIVEIRTLEPINDNISGVFLFNPINFHGGYSHFLLVEKDSFQIINMRESFSNNIEKLTFFLIRNEQYDKYDVLFYISAFIRINNNNLNRKGIVTTKRKVPEISEKFP